MKKKAINFFDDGAECSELMKGGDITITQVSAYVNRLQEAKDEFEAIFDNAELHTAVENIKALREDFMTQENCDIIATLRGALRSIPEAVQRIKDICERNVCVANEIRIILESGVGFEELFD